jgi:hypothetical protein
LCASGVEVTIGQQRQKGEVVVICVNARSYAGNHVEKEWVGFQVTRLAIAVQRTIGITDNHIGDTERVVLTPVYHVVGQA